MDQITIFAKIPFKSIRFYPNSYAHSFSIVPALSDGLIFDTTNGIIHGLYSGPTRTVTYRIAASSANATVETYFTIEYKSICRELD